MRDKRFNVLFLTSERKGKREREREREREKITGRKERKEENRGGGREVKREYG